MPKLFFPEGMGGVQIVVEIPAGWGGYFSGQKMEIPGRRGGLREIPSVVGVWIFSGTTHCGFPVVHVQETRSSALLYADQTGYLSSKSPFLE